MVNGIDVRTVDHTAGQWFMSSGRNQDASYPHIAALFAACNAFEGIPLTYLFTGGFGGTGGLVPRSSVDGEGLASVLDTLLDGEVFQNRGGRPAETYQLPGMRQHIEAAVRQRKEHLDTHDVRPAERKARSELYLSQLSARQLDRIRQALPSSPETGLRGSLQMTLAWMHAGTTVSACIHEGGFDTHDNHYDHGVERHMHIVDAIDFTLREAERLGLRDRLVLLVSSEFGRTPSYNRAEGRLAGKDHWPVTSCLLAGPPGFFDRPGRVIGGSDEGQVAQTIDPTTGAIGGDLLLTPPIVQRALRRRLGIEDHDLARLFPLGGDQTYDLF